jgi:hypothetical protein
MANEKRLIDAYALKERLLKLEASGGHKYYRKGMDDTLHHHMPNIIDKQPTVDAVEVVRVRWEKTLVPDGYVQKASRLRKKCSVCGWTNACRYKYCPNCGAKMDGDGNG